MILVNEANVTKGESSKNIDRNNSRTTSKIFL